MTQFEKAEISRLPKKYKPMGAWGYFWYSVLFALPVIGFISLIVCACSDGNLSRRGYARGMLIGIVISLIVVVLIAAGIAALFLGGFIPQEILDAFAAYVPTV